MSQPALEPASNFAQRLRSLPPLPDVAQEIIQKISCEFVDGNTVADIVAKDPAIAARLIGVANSAYFGLAEPVSDMRQVVNQVLGVDAVRSMAIALATQSLVRTDSCPAFDSSRFWRRSLSVGVSAQRIALKMQELEANDRPFAYLLGLCHNLGLLVLATLEPERLHDVLATRDENTPLDDAIGNEFATSVGGLTLAIAQHWRLPDALLQSYRAAYIDGETNEGLAQALHASIAAIRAQDAPGVEDDDDDTLQQAGLLSDRDRDTIQEAVSALSR